MWLKIRGHAQKICKKAGVHFLAYQDTPLKGKKKGKDQDVPLILFNDPQTKTTLGIRADEFTVENVKAKLKESRKMFKGGM